MSTCPQCQSDHVIKNGSTAGKPKKQCKQCGYQFTCSTPRGKPLATKINAVLWYLSGMSMHRIAFLLRVSAQAVLTWMRALAKDSYEKPGPTGRIIVLKLDEMWHYLQKKRQKLWIWKALDRDTGELLDWECGRRDKATLKQMINRLAQWDVKMYWLFHTMISTWIHALFRSPSHESPCNSRASESTKRQQCFRLKMISSIVIRPLQMTREV
jgi:IS1 family transposase/transposase-like protein